MTPVKLGEIVSEECFQNGLYKPSSSYGTGTPIIRINDFDNVGRLTSETFKRVELSIDERRQFDVREKDILVNRVNSLTHVGKSILVPALKEDTVYESNMMRIRIEPNNSLMPEYVALILQSERIRTFFRKVAKPAVAQASINQDDVRSITIVVYPKPVQQELAKAIGTWDAAIEKMKKLIEAKELYYVYELSRRISRTHHPRCHISAFAHEVSNRNRSNGCERVLSVTNTRGFILPEEQFERRVASDDLSNYKIVRKGQYAYNPSRINVGSIARLDQWEDGALSPMYVVFRLDEGKINSDYFFHWLSSHEARERIKRSAQGSVRDTVGFGELRAISIPSPDLQTQKRIALALNAMREEIDLLRKLSVSYRIQKSGLMQKLLTGKLQLKTTGEVS